MGTALAAKIQKFEKVKTMIEVLTELIINHELAEESLLKKIHCRAAHLTPREVDKLRKRNATNKFYLSKRSESRMIERDELKRVEKKSPLNAKREQSRQTLKSFKINIKITKLEWPIKY